MVFVRARPVFEPEPVFDGQNQPAPRQEPLAHAAQKAGVGVRAARAEPPGVFEHADEGDVVEAFFPFDPAKVPDDDLEVVESAVTREVDLGTPAR